MHEKFYESFMISMNDKFIIYLFLNFQEEKFHSNETYEVEAQIFDFNFQFKGINSSNRNNKKFTIYYVLNYTKALSIS